VRVNDRGPFLKGRIIDLSHEAASILGYIDEGSAEVEVRYVGPAPLSGDDTRLLRASVNRLTPYERERDILYAMSRESTPHAAPIPETRSGLAAALFGYSADAGGLGEAESAAAALGAGVAATATEAQDPAVRLELGLFDDYETAVHVVREFALLGAVDETYGSDGVRLALTHLKPGARIEDVLRLARELGLGDRILY
jgi:rare lipoprotein A